MSRPENKSHFDSEFLVAYLDGELPEEDARTVEKALATDDRLQRKVDQLAQVWNLLDELPETRASQEFTARTASTIAVTQAEEAQPVAALKPQSRGGIVMVGWVAGLGLSLLFGFLLTNRWIGRSDDAFLDDLPVVENLQLYREVGSMEFLKQLQESGIFDHATEDKDP